MVGSILQETNILFSFICELYKYLIEPVYTSTIRNFLWGLKFQHKSENFFSGFNNMKRWSSRPQHRWSVDHSQRAAARRGLGLHPYMLTGSAPAQIEDDLPREGGRYVSLHHWQWIHCQRWVMRHLHVLWHRSNSTICSTAGSTDPRTY
jgi:hypothetical protein